MELDDAVHEEITRLCEKGNEYFENGELDKAVQQFMSALDLLPEPKTDWEAASWLYASIGDVYFAKKEYQETYNCFQQSIISEGALNPFIFLRLGQSAFELNKMEKAKEYLLTAYGMDGMDIFEGEDEKYIDCLKQVIK